MSWELLDLQTNEMVILANELGDWMRAAFMRIKTHSSNVVPFQQRQIVDCKLIVLAYLARSSQFCISDKTIHISNGTNHRK